MLGATYILSGSIGPLRPLRPSREQRQERVYGVAAFAVERTAEFTDAFAAALAHPGPALVHVKADLRDISAAGPLPT